MRYQDANTLSPLNAALLYALHGHPVLPLQPNGKAPLNHGGKDNATTDPAVIRGWWAFWPEANIGLAMRDRYHTLDIDNKKGQRGTESYLAAGGEPMGFCPQPIQRTPNAGYHILFRADDELTNFSHKGEFGGLDVRASGKGYILAAPSVIDGKRYAWELNGDPRAPLPEELLENLRTWSSKKATVGASGPLAMPTPTEMSDEAVEGLIAALGEPHVAFLLEGEADDRSAQAYNTSYHAFRSGWSLEDMARIGRDTVLATFGADEPHGASDPWKWCWKHTISKAWHEAEAQTRFAAVMAQKMFGGVPEPVPTPADEPVPTPAEEAEPKHLSPPTPDEDLWPRDRDLLRELLTNDDPVSLIDGATGAGKTFAMAKEAVRRFADGESTVFVAHTKEGLRLFEGYLFGEAKHQGVEVALRRCYQADGNDSGADLEKGCFDDADKPVVVSAVGTMLRRKGHSARLYPLWDHLREAKNPPLILLDEADIFMEGLQWFQPLDTRVRDHGHKHAQNKKTPIAKCPKVCHNGTRLDKCELRKDTLYQGINAHSLLELENKWYAPAEEAGKKKVTTLLEPCHGVELVGDKLDLGTRVVQDLRIDTRPQRVEGMEAMQPPGTVYPQVRSEWPFDAGKEQRYILQDALYPRLWTHQRDGEGYPHLPCEVRYLTFLDALPLKLLHQYTQRGGRVRLGTGTMTTGQSTVLSEVFGAVPKYEIGSQAPKLERLLILVANFELQLPKHKEVALAAKETGHRVISFLPKMEQAKEYAGREQGLNISVYARGWLRYDNFRTGEIDWLITYPRGAYGRGVNLPEFDINIVSTESYQPTASLLCASLDEDALRLASMENAAINALQPAGRVVRPREGDDHRCRVIILNGPSAPGTAPHLKKSLQARVKEEIEMLPVSIRSTAIPKYIDAFFKRTEVELTDTDVAKADREAFRKLRREPRKRDSAIDRLLLTAEVMEQGATWKEASRRHNTARGLKVLRGPNAKPAPRGLGSPTPFVLRMLVFYRR